MKSTWIALLLGLSIACLGASYFLLPKVNIGAAPQEVSPFKSDTLALPIITKGTFLQIAKAAHVSSGDTLGYILKDRFGAVKDSLFAFAKTSLLPANLATFPEGLREELSTMLKPAERRPQVRKIKRGGYVLKGIEREYLESEIMGAEDASTEMLGKLTQLADGGRGNAEASKNLQRKLQQKQSFITSAQKRLSERKKVVVAEEMSMPVEQPTLTVAQRERILTLASQLPIDTQSVYAPMAGRYYRPDSGVGYIIARSAGQSTMEASAIKGKSGYILKSEGSPVLWGTAERQDSTDGSASSEKELKVSIQ